MQPLPSVTITQTVQGDQDNPIRHLHLVNPANAPQKLEQSNIPKRARELVQKIIENDLFTTDQKLFASLWESHFNQLLTHPNQLLAAKALCFFGIKVITPASISYKDNGLAIEQLGSIEQAQRQLLALLLPENTDIDGFIIQREELYDLMLETNAKLQEILSISRQIEQWMLKEADKMKDKILSGAFEMRSILQKLAREWKFKMELIHSKLCELTTKADDLNQTLQKQAKSMIDLSLQLASDQNSFQKTTDDLINLLKKV